MAQITALGAMDMLRILGLSVRLDGEKLFVAPAEMVDDDVAWLVRTHKAAIVAALLNDATSWAWLVRYTTHAVETYHHPERTRAEVMAAYPGALSAERLPECDWPLSVEPTHS